MDRLFKDVVDQYTLSQAKRNFEENENEDTILHYGSCLVRSGSSSIIRYGIDLLKDLQSRTSNTFIEDDCLKYLSVGYYKLKKYYESLKYVDEWSIYNSNTADEMKTYIKAQKLSEEILGGVLGGGIALAVGYGLSKLFKWATSGSEERLESSQRASSWGSGACGISYEYRRDNVFNHPSDYSSSSSNESLSEGSLCYELVGIHIGNEFNQWQQPLTNYGECEPEWLQQIKTSPHTDDMDFGRREWARAQTAVNKVLDILKEELRSKAEKYQGLRIDSYILQGSSRDGLKVIAPDEFDVGIEFHIEGVHLIECPILKNDRKVPGLCYLKVTDSVSTIQTKCGQLWKKGVFIKDDHGELYLSSKKLHQAVFTSLMDQCFITVGKKIKKKGDLIISRSSHPPAITITIELSDEAYESLIQQESAKRRELKYPNIIYVDIIPALRIRTDNSTECCGKMVKAPIHAICKWKEVESAKALEFANQNMICLLNSVAYERFVFDVARNVTKQVKQQYILTALRLLKTYLTNVKKSRGSNISPLQVSTVLQSYHLKQLTCYLIMYTCYKYKNIKIEGAQKALTYLVKMLETCLAIGKLPHFFYSNSSIDEMFENYPNEPQDGLAYRYCMLRSVSKDSKLQALSSLYQLRKDLGLSSCVGVEFVAVINDFKEEINHGDYI